MLMNEITKSDPYLFYGAGTCTVHYTYTHSTDVRRHVDRYLVKWKGWGPYHVSWELAEKVDAPALVEAYERDLRKQREYLDGAIDDSSDTGNTDHGSCNR